MGSTGSGFWKEQLECTTICHTLVFVFLHGSKIILLDDTLSDQPSGRRAGSRLELCMTEFRAVSARHWQTVSVQSSSLRLPSPSPCGHSCVRR